jgi:hypothetical protein
VTISGRECRAISLSSDFKALYLLKRPGSNLQMKIRRPSWTARRASAAATVAFAIDEPHPDVRLLVTTKARSLTSRAPGTRRHP